MKPRQTLPTMTPRIKSLPVDERGYPVPWFVQWFDNGIPGAWGVGKPDFRVVDERKKRIAIVQKRCWICGGLLGRHMAFVIGPMCAINRVSSEPPSHRDCAVFAATGCPFLAMPKMHRREEGIPAGVIDAPGVALDRNPGVAMVWMASSYKLAAANGGNDGVLFRFGDPSDILFFCEGRKATLAEVMHSIDTGLPALQAAARSEGTEKELDVCYREAKVLVEAHCR